MNKKILPVCFVFIFSVVSCKKDSEPVKDNVLPADSMKYYITLKTTWSSKNNPAILGNFPTNAHFSRLIGSIHSENNSIAISGELASTGIKNMAERGITAELSEEIKTQITKNTAYDLIIGSGLSKGEGTINVKANASTSYHYLSLTTMLAPSPDWFLFVSSFDLMPMNSNGVREWVTDTSFAVFIYDAGTDSGMEFTSSNKITSPFENIHKLVPDTIAEIRIHK